MRPSRAAVLFSDTLRVAVLLRTVAALSANLAYHSAAISVEHWSECELFIITFLVRILVWAIKQKDNLMHVAIYARSHCIIIIIIIMVMMIA